MQADKSINTGALAGKERARKVSEVRKKMVKFPNQKCSVYVVPLYRSPVNTNQARLKWPSIRNAQGKAKEKGKKGREKRGKMRDQIEKKILYIYISPCAYIFPPWPLRHDLSWMYKIGSAWLWRITYLLSFSSKLCLISCLCWIPEVNIQTYLHFGCIFQKPSAVLRILERSRHPSTP